MSKFQFKLGMKKLLSAPTYLDKLKIHFLKKRNVISQWTVLSGMRFGIRETLHNFPNLTGAAGGGQSTKAVAPPLMASPMIGYLSVASDITRAYLTVSDTVAGVLRSPRKHVPIFILWRKWMGDVGVELRKSGYFCCEDESAVSDISIQYSQQKKLRGNIADLPVQPVSTPV